MSRPETPHPRREDPQPAVPDSGPRRWAVVLAPAGALVVGLLLGGLVVGVAGGGDSSPGATPTPTSQPSSSAPSADTAVVVPQECVQAAETVRRASQLLRDNIAAIRDFKAQQIVDLLNQLEDLDGQARRQADACSEISVNPADPSSTSS